MLRSLVGSEMCIRDRSSPSDAALASTFGSSPGLFGSSPMGGNVAFESDSDCVDRSSTAQLSEDDIRGRWPLVQAKLRQSGDEARRGCSEDEGRSGVRTEKQRGRRRARRQLFENQLQSEPLSFEEVKKLLRVHWRSGFEALFDGSDASAAEKWAPFVEVQLGNQEQLLQHLVDGRKPEHTLTPSRCFARIETRLRSELKKVLDRETLADVELGVKGLVGSDEPTKRIFGATGYHRLLIHACAQYYGIKSKSEGQSCAGGKEVVLTKVGDGPEEPPMGLLDYLDALKAMRDEVQEMARVNRHAVDNNVKTEKAKKKRQPRRQVASSGIRHSLILKSLQANTAHA
eukprot:TRINITY_DN27060_c0_g1_i1.p1 TRINITY_DN27060_c0_g1~~TRINITY_DN27060_c0_g1_i1.p1  ORF type:complete len:344 (+),score=99.88 TRINITY_DN27060_c0_g1_i1:97-1128(+)